MPCACLSLFKGIWIMDNALNRMTKLLVSSEGGRQLDWMILEGLFQQNYS